MEYEIDVLDKKIRRVDTADEVVNWIVRIILVALLMLVISFLYDTYAPDDKSAVYHDGDTWITMIGTNIDYPIVQGKDNFEYLDRDPDGNFYSGGSIFLDYRNKYDFSDEYSVIYGHNMVGGKMFGDIKKYYDQKFFDEHPDGMLFTPKQNYKLKVIGIIKSDAYKGMVYDITEITSGVLDTIARCKPVRNVEIPGHKILALSSCSSTMDDQRDIVFCTMTETDQEYADLE